MIPNTIKEISSRKAEIDGRVYTMPHAPKRLGFTRIFADEDGRILTGEVMADKTETLWHTAETAE